MLGTMSNNQADKKLQGGQRFATTPNEQAQVLIDTLDVKCEWVSVAHLNHSTNIHVLQDMLQDIYSYIDIIAARRLDLLHFAFNCTDIAKVRKHFGRVFSRTSRSERGYWPFLV